MRQQMALGDFIFSLSRDFAYSTLIRKTAGGWVELNILQSKPKSSQTGPGLESLTIGGKAMGAAGMERLDQLRALQARAVPLPLVDGIGRNWGLWRIDSVSETQGQIIDDGTAMVVDWTVELKEFVNA